MSTKRLDYSVINEFYAPHFEEVFNTVIPDGKIQRYLIEMNYV